MYISMDVYVFMYLRINICLVIIALWISIPPTTHPPATLTGKCLAGNLSCH